jgi:electron transport complex protein RnfG
MKELLRLFLGLRAWKGRGKNDGKKRQKNDADKIDQGRSGKNMKDFLKLIFVLFVTCAVAAGSLSFINQVTKQPIAEFVKIEKLESMKKVQPDATEFKVLLENRLWEALQGKDSIGYVIMTKNNGYGGPLTIMFGLDLDLSVTKVRIISHNETPGLGAKITTPEFIGQYDGKSVDEIRLKKDDPAKGAIDAISGATVSSRAVTNAIRKDLADFVEGNFAADSATGATR